MSAVVRISCSFGVESLLCVHVYDADINTTVISSQTRDDTFWDEFMKDMYNRAKENESFYKNESFYQADPSCRRTRLFADIIQAINALLMFLGAVCVFRVTL